MSARSSFLGAQAARAQAAYGDVLAGFGRQAETAVRTSEWLGRVAAAADGRTHKL